MNTTNLLLLVGFVAAMLLMSFNYKKRKKKIIFFGDSNTVLGSQPGGFVQLLKEMINHYGLDEKFNISGSGINENTINDLNNRIAQELLADEPFLSIVYIGVNDAWQMETTGSASDEIQFEKKYREILTKILEAGSKVILCTPGVIGEKNHGLNPLDDILDSYTTIIKKLGREYDIHVIDIRSAFMDYFKENNPENLSAGLLTTDGVHLNITGHQFVAAATWKVIHSFM